VVREAFARALSCPACRTEGVLALGVKRRDQREVREGELTCSHCGREFGVHRGVPELLFEAPPEVRAEVAGLERFAALMREDGLGREFILSLPYVQNGYWYAQARSLNQILLTVPFRPGDRLLDVGAQCCWATSKFAERGLSAIALDIATVELQGLHSADYFLEDGEVYFERVLGSMQAIPLASRSVDYVFCCQVLHHNDLQGLRRTLNEIYRVLRPGGKLLVVNETLRTLRDPTGMHYFDPGVHTRDVREFEGNEHAHPAWRYRSEAVRAGFQTEIVGPHYLPFFGDDHLHLSHGTPPLQAIGAGVAYALRSSELAGRLYLAWVNNASKRASLSMIATKPNLFPGPAGASPPERVARRLAATAYRHSRHARAPLHTLQRQIRKPRRHDS